MLCGESAGLAPRSAATRLRCWPSSRQLVSSTPLFSAGLKLSDGRAGHNSGERSTRRRSRTCSGARGREAAPRRRAALSAKNTGAAANRACSRSAEQSASFPAMRLAISGTRSSERASSRLRPHDAELARFACSPPSQPSQAPFFTETTTRRKVSFYGCGKHARNSRGVVSSYGTDSNRKTAYQLN